MSRNFALLWQSQFVGDLGGTFSSVAIPATLILVMQATPLQIGALEAVSSGMWPLCALVAGVLADRARKRQRLLLLANAVRLVALLTIPLTFFSGRHPSIGLFFLVAALIAAASALFDTAYVGFMPHVVGERRAAATNAQLAMGSSLAEAAGTSVAGFLVVAIGAPLVVLVNVATFAYTTCALAAIRVDERPRQRGSGAPLRVEFAEGCRAIARQPELLAATMSNALAHFGGGIAATVATVFLYRDAHLSPLALGIVMGCANAGAFAAFYAARIADRFGMRRTLGGAHLASALAKAALPLLAGLFPAFAFFTYRILLTASGPIFAVNDANLRLALVPDRLRGRATATARTIVWTALPTGSLVGGALGEHFGLGPTMLVGSAITALASLVVYTRSRQDWNAAAALACAA